MEWLVRQNVPAYATDRDAVKWLARRLIRTNNIRASDGPNRDQRKALYRQAIDAQQRQRDLYNYVLRGC